MELITRDGKFFISKSDYDILHDLHRKIPDYARHTEVAIKVIDAQIDDLRGRMNTLGKFRRELTEIAYTFKALNQQGGE